MTDHHGASGWSAFWSKGGWWRSVLAVVAYFVLFQLGSLLFAPLLASESDPSMIVLVSTALPIALGGVLLIAFTATTGQLRTLFARQPISGRWWMWIAVVAVLLFNILRFATTDYADAGTALALTWLLTGLFIGFAEEFLTRGIVVQFMRRAGYREIVVAVVSAALFAAMHAGNLLSGQPLFPTLVQLVYTFAFGLCMYLTLRVTGNLIWPILLHASTDPSIFLQSTLPAEAPLAAFAGLGNIVTIAAGLILLIFIRGRVTPPQRATPAV